MEAPLKRAQQIMDGLTPDNAPFTQPRRASQALALVHETRAAWQRAKAREQAAEQQLFQLERAACKEGRQELGLRARHEAEAAREEAEALAEETLAELQGLARVSPRAARDLADLLWDLLSESEERGDTTRAAHYVSLLRAHDDGRYVDLVEGTATLEVFSEPAGARVTLIPWGVENAPARVLGSTPLPPIDLEQGHYLLELESPGCAKVRRLLRLGRATDMRVVVRLFAARDVGPDAFYLPAGRATVATKNGHPDIETSFVDNLAVSRRAVTVGEFWRFLDTLAERDPERALRYTPTTMGAGVDASARVTGVSYAAARDYARWISERTGVEYRLPNESEWEKAAMSPASEGALDGHREWMAPMDGEGEPLLRGGDFSFGRQLPRGHAVPEDAGFRLVRDLTPGGGEQISALQIPELVEASEAA